MARLVQCLFFISFLDLFAVSLIVPLLSGHLISLGASHVLVGLVSSIYGVLQFFSGPLAGSWSDVKGRRTILLYTVMCCSICYMALGLTSHVLLIILIRVVLGTIKHTQSLCRATLSDAVPYDDQAEVFGHFNAFSGIGFIVGPLIGGHLAELQHGFFCVCCMTSVIFIVIFCIALIFIPKTMPENKNEDQRRETSLWAGIMKAVTHLHHMNWSLYWDAFSLKLILAFSVSLLFSNYSLALQERFNLTPSTLGYTISFQSVLGALSGFGAGAVSRMYKQGPAKLTQHGFILLAVSFTVIVFCSSLWLFVLALAPLAISSSLLRTSLSQWSLEKAPPGEKGSVLGAQHSLSAMSRMMAPLIAGIAQSAFGPTGPGFISLLTSLFGIVIASKISKKQMGGSVSTHSSKYED